jgi:hypothetical protein
MRPDDPSQWCIQHPASCILHLASSKAGTDRAPGRPHGHDGGSNCWDECWWCWDLIVMGGRRSIPGDHPLMATVDFPGTGFSERMIMFPRNCYFPNRGVELPGSYGFERGRFTRRADESPVVRSSSSPKIRRAGVSRSSSWPLRTDQMKAARKTTARIRATGRAM